jgi:hypothetical protein
MLAGQSRGAERTRDHERLERRGRERGPERRLRVGREGCQRMRKKPEKGIVDVRGGACSKVRIHGDSQFITVLTVISSDQISEKTPIPPPDWEALIEVIAKDMIDERSPARILQVRAKLYDLLTHCIPATTILKVCLRTLPHPGRQFG